MCNANAHTMAFNQPKKKVNKKKIECQSKEKLWPYKEGGGRGETKKLSSGKFLISFIFISQKLPRQALKQIKDFIWCAILKLKSFVFIFPNFSLGYFYVGCYCSFPVALQGNGHDNEVILKLLHDFWIISIGSIKFVIKLADIST